jgi:hypothetical protein
VVEADKEKYYNNPSEQKGELYKAWLKGLKTDMYIDESVQMISEIAKLKTQTAQK